MLLTRKSFRDRIKIAAQSNDGTAIDSRVNDIINEKIDELVREADWPYLRSTFEFQTEEEAGSGLVVSQNQGSTTITATTGTFTAAMVGMKIVVKPDTIARKITAVAGGGGSCTVDRAREGDDITGAGVTIFQDVYAIPTRCRKIDFLQNLTVPKDHEGDGLLTKRTKQELQDLHPDTSETGEPTDWAEEDDEVTSYATGTVTVSASSNSLAFSTAALQTQEIEEGMRIRIETEVFVIKSITDETHCKTYQLAVSAHSAVSDWEIEKRVKRVRLHPAPTEIYTIQVPYNREEYGLHQDSDVWAAPVEAQSLIVHGAALQLMAEMGTANPEGFAEFSRSYGKGLEDSRVKAAMRNDDSEQQMRASTFYGSENWSSHA